MSTTGVSLIVEEHADHTGKRRINIVSEEDTQITTSYSCSSEGADAVSSYEEEEVMDVEGVVLVEEVIEEEIILEEELMEEEEYADQVIESWAEAIEEEPEDLEAAVSGLIAVVYKDDPDVDVETMLRRTPLPELYKYLKSQYWYKIHTNKEEGVAQVVQEEPSNMVCVDDMLKGRLQGLIETVQKVDHSMSLCQHAETTTLQELIPTAQLVNKATIHMLAAANRLGGGSGHVAKNYEKAISNNHKEEDDPNNASWPPPPRRSQIIPKNNGGNTAFLSDTTCPDVLEDHSNREHDEEVPPNNNIEKENVGDGTNPNGHSKSHANGISNGLGKADPGEGAVETDGPGSSSEFEDWDDVKDRNASAKTDWESSEEESEDPSGTSESDDDNTSESSSDSEEDSESSSDSEEDSEEEETPPPPPAEPMTLEIFMQTEESVITDESEAMEWDVLPSKCKTENPFKRSLDRSYQRSQRHRREEQQKNAANQRIAASEAELKNAKAEEDIIEVEMPPLTATPPSPPVEEDYAEESEIGGEEIVVDVNEEVEEESSTEESEEDTIEEEMTPPPPPLPTEVNTAIIEKQCVEEVAEEMVVDDDDASEAVQEESSTEGQDAASPPPPPPPPVPVIEAKTETLEKECVSEAATGGKLVEEVVVDDDDASEEVEEESSTEGEDDTEGSLHEDETDGTLDDEDDETDGSHDEDETEGSLEHDSSDDSSLGSTIERMEAEAAASGRASPFQSLLTRAPPAFRRRSRSCNNLMEEMDLGNKLDSAFVGTVANPQQQNSFRNFMDRMSNSQGAFYIGPPPTIETAPAAPVGSSSESKQLSLTSTHQGVTIFGANDDSNKKGGRMPPKSRSASKKGGRMPPKSRSTNALEGLRKAETCSIQKDSPNTQFQTLVEGICPDYKDNKEWLSESFWQTYFQPITEDRTKFYNMEAVRAMRGEDLPTLRRIFYEQKQQQRAGGHRRDVNFNNPMEACNRQGESFLHLACRRRNADLVRFLVEEAKVGVKVRDDWGKTPLHELCWISQARTPAQFESAQLLIHHAPELLIARDRRGYLPLQYIPKETWRDWSRFLEENKQDLEWKIELIDFERAKEDLRAALEPKQKHIPL